MKEEDLIRRKCGSKDPFRIPEGYFENFTAELMCRLPDKTLRAPAPHTRRISNVIWYVAAAVCCGFIFCGTLHFSQRTSTDKVSVRTSDANPNENTNNYMDDYLDYAMVSNHEIAQYLTETY